MRAPLRPRQLHHAALGREGAAERVERPARLELADHLAVRLGRVGRRLGQRAAVDRRRRAVDVAAADQLADQGRRPARRVEVRRHEAPAGHEVGQHRRAGADGGELVEAERHARLARDRQQVQEAVGRAAAGDRAGHRVLERAAVEEAPGGRAVLGELHRERPGALRGGVLLLGVGGGDQPVADHAEAEHVDDDRHRVGGEVAGAVAGAGARLALDDVELLARDPAAVVRADGLPHVLDRQRAVAVAAGEHRPAGEHHRRAVDARERHQRGGHRLVAADEADERVEVVRVDHQLDRVRDHLARDQRRAHARRRLRLVVGDRDRVELERHAAGRLDRLGDLQREPPVVEVARHRPRPRRGDADDRPVEPLGVDAHGAEVRAGPGPLGTRPQSGPGAAPCSVVVRHYVA